MKVVAIHVVPHREGWALRLDRAEKILCTCATREEALCLARKQADSLGARVLIHPDQRRRPGWLVPGFAS